VSLVVAALRDPRERGQLSSCLRESGFQVEETSSVGGLLAVVRTRRPDLVVLDSRLDDMSGTAACRSLRAEPEMNAVLIVLLCESDQEIDRIVGLEVGADDVVPKPYSLRELGLRVRAKVRRSPVFEPSEPGPVFDTASHRVTIDGRTVTLTRRELRLLTFLHERCERVQSREALLDAIWRDQGVDARAVDASVKRLRDKLGHAGRHIQTVRGVGYRYSR
jgi:two-component system phosphate regulon response regulator PhoB